MKFNVLTDYVVDPNRCPATFRLSSRDIHEQNCDFAPIQCPNNEGCGLIARSRLHDHLRTCRQVPSVLYLLAVVGQCVCVCVCVSLCVSVCLCDRFWCRFLPFRIFKIPLPTQAFSPSPSPRSDAKVQVPPFRLSLRG